MMNRRNLLLGATALSLSTITRIFPAYGQVETAAAILAAAAKALLAKLVENLAKQLSERILPARFDEINSKLDAIAAQVTIIINILLQLPAMIDKVVRQNFEDETKAIITSFNPHIEAIRNELRKRRRLTDDQRIQLNGILVILNSNIEKVWKYGYSVYPVVTYGILSSVTIYKLLGSKRTEWQSIIKSQIDKHFNNAIDQKDKNSFPALQQSELELMNADIAYLNKYPRRAYTNCFSRVIGRGESADLHTFYTYAVVRPPSVIPADKFAVVGDQSGRTEATGKFPDVQYPPSCGDAADVRGQVERLLNGKLNSMKAHRDQAAAFGLITDDVKAIIATLRKL